MPQTQPLSLRGKPMKLPLATPPPAAGPVTRAELDALRADVEALRVELIRQIAQNEREAAALELRMKDATQHEIRTGFDAVKVQLPTIIAGGLKHVEDKLDALIKKAEAAEAYRELRQEIEKEVAARQGVTLDFAIKKTQLEHEVLVNHEFPKESMHKRRLGLYTVVSGFLIALLGLIAAAIASHRK
jgi:hypothetical protein